jgi:6-phosphogluconolactonase
MNFIHSQNSDTGAHELALRISESLKQGKRTLWLIPGGSNIPTAVSVMAEVRKAVPASALDNLTVSLCDERFGPAGHPDSNWKQLVDAGLNFERVSAIPILEDLSLEDTVSAYGANMALEFENNDVIIAQFGIGPDGHIAGMLPHTPAVTDTHPACGYQSEKFTRITLTPPMLVRISVAYVFAFGPSKAEALVHLRDKDLSIDEEPCQILKKIPEVHIYSDQI